MRPTAPALIIELISSGSFELFLSQHILGSLEGAWSKPYFRTRISPAKQRESINWLMETAVFVIPDSTVHGVAEDEEDDLVLATAIAAEADYLVSGDKYLQRIVEFRGIPIVSPREFLDLMLDLPPET
jgi:uncharacterized protein